jgi:hypothetical protein
MRANVGDGMKFMMDGFYRGFGLSDSEIERRLYGDLKELPDPMLNGQSPRYAMQTLGYEWRDLISPTLWADRWADRVRGGNVVADGMRYPDEMPGFRKLGGTLVKVVRPGAEANDNGHKAESLMLEDEADFNLLNIGTIEDLHGALDRLIRYLTNAEGPAVLAEP